MPRRLAACPETLGGCAVLMRGRGRRARGTAVPASALAAAQLSSLVPKNTKVI